MAWFLFRVRLQFSGKFQTLRVANEERIAKSIDGPLIVVLNHPSYWDPVTGQLLQLLLLPQRVLYSAAAAGPLEGAGHLRKRGHFPVEPGTASGARQFLRECEHLLSLPDTMLSINPEGEYRDPRLRPLELKRGLAALVARMDKVTILPLAIDYTFWEGDRPEMLASFGEEIQVEDGGAQTVDEWHALLSDALTTTMDELAELNMRRDASRFRSLIHGRLGPRNLKLLVGEIKALYRRKR